MLHGSLIRLLQFTIVEMFGVYIWLILFMLSLQVFLMIQTITWYIIVLSFPSESYTHQRYYSILISNKLNYIMIRGLSRTQSDIQDGAFCKNS